MPYKEAARQFHPDVNTHPGSEEAFINIQQAYETLSNPQKQAEYNELLGLPSIPNNSISINIINSREKIQSLDDPQLFYTLIELTPKTQDANQEAPPLNLGLVIDRSTSMQGAKMDLVKANTIQILRQLRDKDSLSVVAFSDTAEVYATGAHNSDFSILASRISLLQAGGSTEIFQGLKSGIDQIRKNLSPSHINHVLIITDGHTYGDEDDCLLLAREAASSGIGISALGLGEKWNDDFMDRLARLGGGNSAYISAPGDLSHFLETKFHSLATIYAENVTLDLKKVENIEVRDVFRLSPDPFPIKSDSTINLGAILSSSSLIVMIEFLINQVPGHLKIFPLLKGRIMMEVLSNPVPTERYTLDINLPIDEGYAYEPPNATILRAMSRLSLYRMQEKAREEVIKGEVAKATRHLQYLATHLLSCGERELAHKVLVEADHIQKNSKYSSNGEKYIKYQTRALLLPAGTEN